MNDRQISSSLAGFILLLASLSFVIFTENVRAQGKPFQISSIAVPLIGNNYLDDHAGWTPLNTLIQQLVSLGATDVKVTVSSGSYDTPLDNLPNPSVNLNPSDAQVVSFLQQLKAAGLQITIVPFANINFDPNGNLLDTVHSQPTNFSTWIAAHTTIMVHWAQIAQQVHAERFIVFSDEVGPLTYGTTNTAGWLSMIAQIQNVYSGQLTSMLFADGSTFNGGNSHIDLTDPVLLAQLDSIGIGWFPQPLTNSPSPTMSALLASWRRTVAGVDTVSFLESVHDKHGKPVWISDVAFHSFSGDNVRNGDIYNMAVPLVADESEQANEIDSILTVLSLNKPSWFLGICFDSWNRFPPDYTGVARFANSPYGENINGKLAQTVLTQWYTGMRGWKTKNLTQGWNLVGNGVGIPMDIATVFGYQNATNVSRETLNKPP